MLVTDGAYFIKDFPDHPMSQYLTDRIPDYRAWAVVARREAKDLEEAREQDRITALNGASQAAFEASNNRMDTISRDVADLHTKLDQVLNFLANLSGAIPHLVNQQQQLQQLARGATREEEQAPAPRGEEQEDDNNLDPEDDIGLLLSDNGSRSDNNEEQRHGQRQHVQQEGVAAVPAVVVVRRGGAGTERRPLVAVQPRTVNNALFPAATPRQPGFAVAMPRTFRSLMTEWQNLGLGRYTTDETRREWGNNLKQAWKKRKTMVDVVYNQLRYVREPDGSAFRGSEEERLRRATEVLDARRGSMTAWSYSSSHLWLTKRREELSP